MNIAIVSSLALLSSLALASLQSNGRRRERRPKIGHEAFPIDAVEVGGSAYYHNLITDLDQISDPLSPGKSKKFSQNKVGRDREDEILSRIGGKRRIQIDQITPESLIEATKFINSYLLDNNDHSRRNQMKKKSKPSRDQLSSKFDISSSDSLPKPVSRRQRRPYTTSSSSESDHDVVPKKKDSLRLRRPRPSPNLEKNSDSPIRVNDNGFETVRIESESDEESDFKKENCNVPTPTSITHLDQDESFRSEIANRNHLI